MSNYGVISTRLSQLPERFTYGPLTKQMDAYVSKRWKRASYGWFKRDSPIDYNREHKLEGKPYVDPTRFVKHTKDGLRYVGKVDEIRGSGNGNLPYFDRALVNHSGWYDNPYGESFKDGSGLIYGEVYQLPARDGKSLYVPAYALASGHHENSATLCFRDTTDDLIEAIRSADHTAEQVAEEEREYQAEQATKDKIEELEAKIKDKRANLLKLCKELRANCNKLAGMDVLRQTIREHVKRVRRHCAKLQKEKEKIENEGLCFY